MRRSLVALAVAVACAHAPTSASAVRTHAYLLIVDGLDARVATAAHMPRLFAAIASEAERSSFFAAARAVMPARTNPNHVTLLTGVYPAAHGMTGNAYWSRRRGAPVEKLESAALIEVETLFTVAGASTPRLATLAVFGKPKLARLFAAVPGRQRAPDILWSPEQLPASRREPSTGYAPDRETMAAALAAMASTEPDLAVINLSDVDRYGHEHGPDSAEYLTAVSGADAAIGSLLDDLHARGRWGRSAVFVTADHGMSAVDAVVSLGPMLREADVRGATVVADGGIEHVYADAALLERVATIARRSPCVEEALTRLDGPRLPRLHPEWHLEHERTGDLVLVARRGCDFIDPEDPVEARLLGNHGSPAELTVPLAVTGGSAALRAAVAGTPSPELVDVAPTIAALLGLRRPRRIDGRTIPDRDGGHPIAAILASPVSARDATGVPPPAPPAPPPAPAP